MTFRRFASLAGPVSAVALLTSAALGQIPAERVAPSESTAVYAFTGGAWYDGEGFTPRTVYVIDGQLTSIAPAAVDSTIDLAGGWVVPPYDEAHTHTLLYRSSRIEAAGVRRPRPNARIVFS
jgi:imidazolonepropionase-like amidohydrolase